MKTKPFHFPRARASGVIKEPQPGAMWARTPAEAGIKTALVFGGLFRENTR